MARLYCLSEVSSSCHSLLCLCYRHLHPAHGCWLMTNAPGAGFFASYCSDAQGYCWLTGSRLRSEHSKESDGEQVLRITLVHWSLPPTVGGVECHLVDVANGLASAGASVTLISGEAAPTHELLPGLDLVYAPQLDIRRPAVERARVISFSELLADASPDVIHCHNTFPLAGQGLASALEKYAYASESLLVHTAHSLWGPGPGVIRSDRWTKLAASVFMARALKLDYGWETTVMPLPVDSIRFSARSRTLKRPARLLHASRLVEEKGGSVSIEACHRLVSDGYAVRLVVASTPSIFYRTRTEPPDLQVQLQNEADRKGLSEEVTFERAPYAGMRNLYDAADIALFPSTFEEPYGLGILQAMSCGRPVIASAVGGIADNIVDNVTGLLIAPGDPSELVRAVKRLIADPALASRIAGAGRDFVRESRNLADFCAQLLSLYARARAVVQLQGRTRTIAPGRRMFMQQG